MSTSSRTPDPRLDPFREAVWELSRDGVVVGHLVTEISTMRTLPALWVKRPWMQFDVIWADGSRECAMGDYPPEWETIAELERGRVEVGDGFLDAKPLSGEDRTRIWLEYVAHASHEHSTHGH